VDTFGAAKESKGDEETSNGIGKRGGYEEESGGIRLRKVRVFGRHKGKPETASSGSVANSTPVQGRLHDWRHFHS